MLSNFCSLNSVQWLFSMYDVSLQPKPWWDNLNDACIVQGYHTLCTWKMHNTCVYFCLTWSWSSLLSTLVLYSLGCEASCDSSDVIEHVVLNLLCDKTRILWILPQRCWWFELHTSTAQYRLVQCSAVQCWAEQLAVSLALVVMSLVPANKIVLAIVAGRCQVLWHHMPPRLLLCCATECLFEKVPLPAHL